MNNEDSFNREKKVPHFMTLHGALENWGKLNNRRYVWDEIEVIVEKLQSKGKSTVSFHTTPNKSHIAATFGNNPKQIGAFIQVGFVDHLEFLEGSEWGDKRKNYRTLLSTSNKW